MSAPADKKVLVVDDSSVAASLATRLLTELGFREVSACESGNKAWKLLTAAMDQGKPYDIVLCDWMMPDGSGLELLELVRADKRFNSTFFCMVTAESESQNIVTAVTAGLNAFMMKPVAEDELRKKLKPFLPASGCECGIGDGCAARRR